MAGAGEAVVVGVRVRRAISQADFDAECKTTKWIRLLVDPLAAPAEPAVNQKHVEGPRT